MLHSLSTNDASLGEYKYTVNVGCHNIKITGDSLDLVRVCDNTKHKNNKKKPLVFDEKNRAKFFWTNLMQK